MSVALPILQRVTMAGGLILPPSTGNDELALLRGRYSVPNPPWKQWFRRLERMERDQAPANLIAQHRMKEPPKRFTALRKIPGGPMEGHHWLPRACGVAAGVYEDRTSQPVASKARFRPEAAARVSRDYQAETLERVAGDLQGLAVIPCAGGKTWTGILGIERFETRALVLVPSRVLLDQWVGELVRWLDVDVGVVAAGKDGRHARVVVATLQSLSRWNWWDLYTWARGFGLVVLDEAHHAPAETVCDVLGALSATRRLGLTATLERSDGLEQIIRWSFGEVLVQRTPGQLERAGFTMAPRITWVPTGFDLPLDPTLAAEVVVDSDERNRLVVDHIGEAQQEGRRSLVLVDRTDHVAQLRQRLAGVGVRADELVGATARRAREKRIDQLERGELSCLVGTSVADEGLDIPTLDTVALLVPGRSRTRVPQRVGRVVRIATNKPTPQVLDFVDEGYVGAAQAWARYSIYRDAGWKAAIPPVVKPDAGHNRDQEPPIDDDEEARWS